MAGLVPAIYVFGARKMKVGRGYPAQGRAWRCEWFWKSLAASSWPASCRPSTSSLFFSALANYRDH